MEAQRIYNIWQTKPSPDREELLLWKLTLLHYGLSLSRNDFLKLKRDGYKIPKSVRTGTSGGLELTLPEYVAVNVPLSVSESKEIKISGYYVGSGMILVRNSFTGHEILARLSLAPKFYERKTSTGKLMSTIGQLCFDRLAIGIERCSFWDNSRTRCKFCAYNFNLSQESSKKSSKDIIEVVSASVRDSISPAKHIMLTGGTSNKTNYGTNYLNLAKELCRITDVPISIMMSPPRKLSLIKDLKNAGVQELAVNIEVYNEAYAKEIIPGKFNIIGRKLYSDSFVRAVDIFGRGRVRSLILVGLEPESDTIDGIDYLAKLGVVPVLSPFQPMVGSDLESTKKPDISQLYSIYHKARKITAHHGLYLGPRCAPCQNNTITMPWDSPDYTPQRKISMAQVQY